MRRERWNSLGALLAIAILLGILYPVVRVVKPGFEIVLTYGVVLAIAALGFNLLFNYAGLLSFGHAAFFGVGAYAVGLTLKYLNLRTLELQIVAGALAAAALALIVGSVAVRYRGIFFAILLLVVGQILWGFYVKFYPITGGTDGIRILKPTLLLIYDTGGLKYHEFNALYHYYALLWFVALATLMWYIVNSPFGYSLRAIRDSETRAMALGINVERQLLIALLISGVYTGIAGALYAPFNRLVTPDFGYWTLSGKIVFMTILGGSSHFIGPIVGAVVYNYLETMAQALTVYWYLLLGAMIIAIMVFMPRGILGLLERAEVTIPKALAAVVRRG